MARAKKKRVTKRAASRVRVPRKRATTRSKAAPKKRRNGFFGPHPLDKPPKSKGVMVRYLRARGWRADQIPTDSKQLWMLYRAAKGQEPIRKANPKKKRRKATKRVAPKKKQRRPAKRKATKKRRRKNPNTGAAVLGAARMFKKFTGRKATRVTTISQKRVTPDALADCGALIELTIDRGHGHTLLRFKGKGVRVGTVPDGSQLYFVKGDQEPDLSNFPNVKLPKDQIILGECAQIVYFTSKDFHDFKPSEYKHNFGEVTGARPSVGYDVHSKRLYLLGGAYRVRRPGIIN